MNLGSAYVENLINYDTMLVATVALSSQRARQLNMRIETQEQDEQEEKWPVCRTFIMPDDKPDKTKRMATWVSIVVILGAAAFYLVESGMLKPQPQQAGQTYPRGL